MNQTSQPLAARISKVLRYSRLYGVQRTWAKIQGQFHTKKRYTSLPACKSRPHSGAHVGLVGCGNFQFTTIAYYLNRNFGRVIHAAMDHNINRSASLFEHYGLNYYTDDFERLVHDPAIDLIFIASNHASHAEYAIKALQHGKHVHIEKPHVVNEIDLKRLCRAMRDSAGKVGLGFNRPSSRMGRAIKSAIDSQSGSAMMNWFVVGHEISADHWYSKPEEGGRVFGNLCHWSDFVYQMVEPSRRYPILITPTRSERLDCDIAVTYLFGDGTIASLTFSAKGHTYEGVRERFSAQRGNVLINMEDFSRLVIEQDGKKRKIAPLFRDHGHENRVRESYALSGRRGMSEGCPISYVWESAELFIKTKQALDENRPVTVSSFDPAALEDN